MTFFPDFTPIEYRGMSVITGLILFFAGVGFTAVIAFIKKEIKDVDEKVNEEIKHLKDTMDLQNKRIDSHSEKLENAREDIGDMKTNIALLLQCTKRIEAILEKNINYKGNQ